MQFVIANFSNFGSLKSTETWVDFLRIIGVVYFSNFGSLKSTETAGVPLAELM